MITTGRTPSSSVKTEVFDLQSNTICQDLKDFPFKLYDAVGGTVNGVPTVCGGSSGGFQDKCYQLIDNDWKELTTMAEKRGDASSIMHDDKMHVFGGYDGGRILDTSEVVSVNGSYPGPKLPTGVWFHTITVLDKTTSILAGGRTDYSFASAKTWYYDHEKQIFSEGPALQQGRHYHGSATAEDIVTKEKIPVVAGGIDDEGTRLNSTELLINNRWITGKIQFQPH